MSQVRLTEAGIEVMRAEILHVLRASGRRFNVTEDKDIKFHSIDDALFEIFNHQQSRKLRPEYRTVAIQRYKRLPEIHIGGFHFVPPESATDQEIVDRLSIAQANGRTSLKNSLSGNPVEANALGSQCLIIGIALQPEHWEMAPPMPRKPRGNRSDGAGGDWSGLEELSTDMLAGVRSELLRAKVLDDEPELVHILLTLLAAVKGPASTAFLKSVAESVNSPVTADRIQACLRRLSGAVLEGRDRRWRLKHKGIGDWLRGSQAAEFAVNELDGLQWIQVWLRNALPRLGLEDKKVLCACSTVKARWSPSELDKMLAYEVGLRRIQTSVQTLHRMGLVEVEQSDLSSALEYVEMVEAVRESAAAYFIEVEPELHDQLADEATALRIEYWEQADLRELFSQAKGDLAQLQEPDWIERIANGDHDSLKTLTQVNQMMSGNILSRAMPPKLLLRPRQATLQAAAIAGMLCYVRGKFVPGLACARAALRWAKPGTPGWIRGGARASEAVLRVLLDQRGFDHAAAFVAALEDLTGSDLNTVYWRGVALMSQGTANWHVLTRDCTDLRRELDRDALDSALTSFQSALECFERVNDRMFRIFALNSIGSLLRLKSDDSLKSSIAIYRQGLRLSVESGNDRGRLGFCHGIAGWSAWCGCVDEFVSLMSKVESIYPAIGFKMVLPIRNEYNLIWKMVDRTYVTKSLRPWHVERALNEAVREADSMAKRLVASATP